MNYSEKLKAPEWSRKRLAVLKRDKFKCTVCNSEKNLVVHHTYYYFNKPDPWMYPLDSLITLCETCHNDYHRRFEITIINRKESKKVKVLSMKKIKKIKHKDRKTKIKHKYKPPCLAKLQSKHPVYKSRYESNI